MAEHVGPCRLLYFLSLLIFRVRKGQWELEPGRKSKTLISQSPLWRAFLGPAVIVDTEKGGTLEEVNKALCEAVPLRK